MSAVNLANVAKIIEFQQPSKTGDTNTTSNNTVTLPLIGRINFVRDSNGQLCALGVLAYWIYGTLYTLYIILYPAREDGLVPEIVVYGFYAVCGLCLMAFLRSMLTNPGRITSYSTTENSEAGWNLCRACNTMRPPRAHHCRRCGQCVLKMDHHCPWINNCVGQENHFAFMQLLAYAFLFGFYTFVLVMVHFWIWPSCQACNKETFYIKHSIWFSYLAFCLSLNMMIVMGIQLSQQHYNLLINKTTLETMIGFAPGKTLELRRCFISYRDLCGRGLPIFWLFPVGRRRPNLLPLYSQQAV